VTETERTAPPDNPRSDAARTAAADTAVVDTAVEETAGRLGDHGFFFDFDGTLSALGEDPQAVVPVPGALEALTALTREAALTAVVSARPVAFLASRLGAVAGLRLHGLYGLEHSEDGGATVATAPEAEPYLPLIARILDEARSAFPGALIEDKRLSCALHFRTAPELEPSIEDWTERQAAEYGLKRQHGRMVVELKPPLDTDKGEVVRAAAQDLGGAWYFGDDLGDLSAFAALDDLQARIPGFHAVRVAIDNADGAVVSLGERADLRLAAPEEVPPLLRALMAAHREKLNG
jgi:trehalose 6-phosphate phosphatase